MKQQLEAIRKAALEAIADAAKAEDLEAMRVRYLGKKGELTAVLKQMGKLSAEERPVIGQLANEVRAALEAGIEKKASELADKAMECKLKEEAVDVTIPGKQEKIGVKHPMYQVLDEIKEIFLGMGFLARKNGSCPLPRILLIQHLSKSLIEVLTDTQSTAFDFQDFFIIFNKGILAFTKLLDEFLICRANGLIGNINAQNFCIGQKMIAVVHTSEDIESA